MMLFHVAVLIVVAELSCLRQSLVFGEGDLDFLSKKADVQHHRTKRWLWGEVGCGLIPGCDECTDGLLCKKCRQAFIPVEYERNRKKIIRCTRSCPIGYNITSRRGYSRICVRTQLGCVARNCDDCHPHNPASCANCTQGFYSLQKKVMGNVRCVLQCPIGFTPNTNKNDGKKICKDTQSRCQAIVPNCAKCLDSFRCRKCRSDFHAFFNKSAMICVQKCPKNLVAVNSSHFGKYCKKPLVECRSVENCVRCPDKINCRRCKPRYFKLKMSAFSNSTCVVSCPLGFAKKGRRCQRVMEDGCLDEYCLTCREGWVRVNYNKRRCQRKCPRGFYTIGEKQKFCLRCLRDCEQCNSSNDCTKCNPETARIRQDPYTARCVESCPFGYTSEGDEITGKHCVLNKSLKRRST